MNKQLSYLESVEVHKEIVRYYRKEALLEAILNAICFCILDGICCLLAGKLAILYNTVIAGIIIFCNNVNSNAMHYKLYNLKRREIDRYIRYQGCHCL